MSMVQSHDLAAYLIDNQIRLIVMSPFTSFLPGLRDSNSNEAVRASLDILQDAIHAAGCALIGIMHVSKKPYLAAVECTTWIVRVRQLRPIGPDRRAGAGGGP